MIKIASYHRSRDHENPSTTTAKLEQSVSKPSPVGERTHVANTVLKNSILVDLPDIDH